MLKIIIFPRNEISLFFFLLAKQIFDRCTSWRYLVGIHVIPETVRKIRKQFAHAAMMLLKLVLLLQHQLHPLNYLNLLVVERVEDLFVPK